MKHLLTTVVLFWCLLSCQTQPSYPHKLSIPENGLSEFLAPSQQVFPMVSAHRGGRNLKGYPENAIETFEYVLAQQAAIIECDIIMTRDSVLFLMHDNTLDRTTTGSGKIAEKNWSTIKDLQLVDDFGNTTDFHPPTLSQMLQWLKEKTIATLDVKRGVPFEMVIEEVKKQQVEDYIVIITYNINDAKKVHQLAPNLMISLSIRNEEEFNRWRASGIPAKNIIAFTGTNRKNASFYAKLHREGIPCIQGTIGNIDRQATAKGNRIYSELIQQGADILATDRPLEAAQSCQKAWNKEHPKMKYFRE